MRSFMGCVISAWFVMAGCALEESPEDLEGFSQEVISPTAASNLINYGRGQLGTPGGQCKPWVQAVVPASYGPTIPSTAANQLEWALSPVVTAVAQWRGSYVNGRLGPLSLNAGGSQSTIFNVGNSDPQVVVVYASSAGVTATISKSGSASVSVSTSSASPTGGTISSSTTSGVGTWTLTVSNGSGAVASGIVAVVLSRSRFQSDWESARRGDMMQMYIGATAANRASSTPHTTFVQTDFNVNGGSTCSGTATSPTNTEGCNWLDSNWVATNTVGAHNISMDTMLKMTAYSASYGFTVHRLN